MGTSYIPKDVYTICTFQQDVEPRQLIPTRSSITVFYGADSTRPLLTVEDRNINREFPCKSPKNAMWSFLCFGAGLLAGIALLSNPIGWAVALGTGIAALSIAAGVYEATQIKHKCSGSLGAGNGKYSTIAFGLTHINPLHITQCYSVMRAEFLRQYLVIQLQERMLRL